MRGYACIHGNYPVWRTSMKTIVVLGGGVGGLAAAFELMDELGQDNEIILVSNQDNFEFTPANPAA